MSPSDAFDLVRGAFERAGIRYAVGGFWASTASGEPRFTNDIDILAELTPDNLAKFLDALPNTFYVDPEEALRAIRNGRPFNAIRIPAVLKFDFFPASSFPLGAQELDRSIVLEQTGLAAGPVRLTAEDILLAKLYWFRVGGETSEVQWRYIRGIVRGSAAAMDHNSTDTSLSPSPRTGSPSFRTNAAAFRRNSAH